MYQNGEHQETEQSETKKISNNCSNRVIEVGIQNKS